MPGGDGRGPQSGGRRRGMGGADRGMRRGRGMGRGMGKEAGSSAPGQSAVPPLSSHETEEVVVPVPDPVEVGASTAPVASRGGELSALRQQAELLSRQLQQIQERIQQLEHPKENILVAARVDVEKCAGCGICVEVCPNQAIFLEESVAVVSEEICTGCGDCVEECPREAISLS